MSISPLRFKYVTEPLESIQAKAAPGTRPTGVAAPIEIHELKTDAEGDAGAPTPAAPEEQTDLIKTFKVHVFPSGPYYDHRKALRSNPLHGRWPLQAADGGEGQHDAVYYALRSVVPDNIAARALCDWRTGGQLSEADRVSRVTPAVAKFVHIRDRHQRAVANRRVEEAAEDELVAWKGLWAGAKTKGERRGRDEGGVGDAGAGAGPEAEVGAVVEGINPGTTTTAAAASGVVLSEWQKLEAAEAALADSVTRPHLRRSPQMKRSSSTNGSGSSTFLDKSRDDLGQLPRKVRRKAFHMEMMKTQREMERRLGQKPSTEGFSEQPPSTQSSPTQNPSDPSTPPPSTPTI